MLSFFLEPGNSELWATVIEIAASAGKGEEDTANRQLRQYVLEAQRLTSYMKDVRVCQEDMELDDIKMNKGDKIIVLTVIRSLLGYFVRTANHFDRVWVAGWLRIFQTRKLFCWIDQSTSTCTLDMGHIGALAER